MQFYIRVIACVFSQITREKEESTRQIEKERKGKKRDRERHTHEVNELRTRAYRVLSRTNLYIYIYVYEKRRRCRARVNCARAGSYIRRKFSQLTHITHTHKSASTERASSKTLVSGNTYDTRHTHTTHTHTHIRKL